MQQIAIVNKSKRLTDDFVAFAAKACAEQVIECAKAWGIEPTPVAFYASESNLPARDCRIMALVDELDEAPGAGGYHIFELGIVYGRVLAGDQNATSVVLSHECLEQLVDPYCNEWRSMGGGRRVALEVCDPVQADTYGLTVEIMGERRAIVLSNYVLPRWFEPAAVGMFDRMGELRAPLSMSEGGYLIIRDADGNEENIFANRPRLRLQGITAKLAISTKLTNNETRLARRLRS